MFRKKTPFLREHANWLGPSDLSLPDSEAFPNLTANRVPDTVYRLFVQVAESNPALSIILVTHNDGPLLDEQLRKLAGTMSSDTELLVIDDGSRDLRTKTIRAHLNTFPGVRYVHTRNRGLSAARNLGLSLMKGTHGVFLDSDDELDPSLLYERVFRPTVEAGNEFAMFLTESYTNDFRMKDRLAEEKRYFSISERITSKQVPGQELATALVRNNSYTVPAWQFLWSREFLESVSPCFAEGYIMEDNAFTFKLFTRAKHCQLFRVFAHRRQVRKKSISNSSDSYLVIAGYIRAYLDMREELACQAEQPLWWQQQVMRKIEWNIVEHGREISGTRARQLIAEVVRHSRSKGPLGAV